MFLKSIRNDMLAEIHEKGCIFKDFIHCFNIYLIRSNIIGMKGEECLMIPASLELGEGNRGDLNKVIKPKGDLNVLINNVAIIIIIEIYMMERF